MRVKTLLFSAIFIFAFSFSALADMPKTINFQGRLMNNGVTPVGTGQITFNIYNIPTGGTSLWTETDTVNFDSGVFSVPLGTVTPLNIDFGQPLWIEMTYSGSTLSPRQSLNTSPYAFFAATAENVTGFGSIPVGSVLPFAGVVTPDGFLECAGQNVSASNYPVLAQVLGHIYGGSGNNFNVPDYRGYFLRGRDAGKVRDPQDNGGRSGGDASTQIGSTQADEFKSHSHDMGSVWMHSGGGWGFPNSGPENYHADTFTAATGGSETRPQNIYVMYIIRAK